MWYNFAVKHYIYLSRIHNFLPQNRRVFWLDDRGSRFLQNLETIYQSTWCHVEDDHNLQIHHLRTSNHMLQNVKHRASGLVWCFERCRRQKRAWFWTLNVKCQINWKLHKKIIWVWLSGSTRGQIWQSNILGYLYCDTIICNIL
jgi:hypothetical protein